MWIWLLCYFQNGHNPNIGVYCLSFINTGLSTKRYIDNSTYFSYQFYLVDQLEIACDQPVLSLADIYISKWHPQKSTKGLAEHLHSR